MHTVIRTSYNGHIIQVAVNVVPTDVLLLLELFSPPRFKSGFGRSGFSSSEASI